MIGTIARRRALAWVGGTFAAPVVVLAAPPKKVHRVGCLWLARADAGGWPAIQRAFEGHGLVEGKNVAFEHRYGAGHLVSLRPLAKELVSSKVDLILATSTPSALAAKEATATIPIVFATVGDPVAYELVGSLARPGGNLTGVALMVASLGGKRLELLAQAVAGLDRVGVLWNPAGVKAELEFDDIGAAARALQITVHPLPLTAPSDFAPHIAAGRAAGCRGVVVCAHPSIALRLRRLAEATREQKMPTIFWAAAFARSGGLMSYGPRSRDTAPRLAAIATRVLAGAKPADLPVEQPLRYDLVINRKTARVFGLKLPRSLLVQATELIDT